MNQLSMMTAFCWSWEWFHSQNFTVYRNSPFQLRPLFSLVVTDQPYLRQRSSSHSLSPQSLNTQLSVSACPLQRQPPVASSRLSVRLKVYNHIASQFTRYFHSKRLKMSKFKRHKQAWRSSKTTDVT